MPLSARIALMLLPLCWTMSATALTPLEGLAERKAEILRIQHKKARRALVNVAQDRAFIDYFTASDAAQRRRDKERIDHIALTVQGRFHTEEMCLIDTHGREISRIVGSHVATELDDDETGTPFFAPAFASRARTVLVTEPYLSDDARKWVVAYVTLIAEDGARYAILHYEHGLDVFQRLVARGQDDPRRFVVLLDSAGRVLADSRGPIPVDRHAHAQAADDYFPRFALAGVGLDALRAALARSPEVTLPDGFHYAVAESHVDDWTVLAIEQREVPRS